ncbi:hypothetical protein K0M31_009484 [Melipona bicolor]|uniref:Uncharacterized protein n=1 Tax=Melipona bicolor TaxID=60889 RepID=A0AA40FNM7_9HYME|nr:hypothetical protein K0M31_009484 [Melipona bicolor]
MDEDPGDGLSQVLINDDKLIPCVLASGARSQLNQQLSAGLPGPRNLSERENRNATELPERLVGSGRAGNQNLYTKYLGWPVVVGE